ncbi:uncharacterized protein LOC124811549 isoform X1 [Hydra vulgaris]|uniref:uncharacterized protein LOC124811549 isoform X1 n=1 Tax=Hydra vulgaris TaxID=6087 RepID=UPI001F5FE322|nr:uncharacterized protein LOC124811549 [Hydra vulgaris]
MKQNIISKNKQALKAFYQGRYYEAVVMWHEIIKIAIVSNKNTNIANTSNENINTADYAAVLYNKARAYEKLECLYLAQKYYQNALGKDSNHTKSKKYLKDIKNALKSFKQETLRNNVEQFIMLESQCNNETKVSILKEIELNEYGILVKKFAHKKSAEEVKNLVIILNDLGYLTTKLGELNKELKYYIEAAVFYQYMIAIIKEKLNKEFITIEEKNDFIKQQLISPYQQLAYLQKLIFSAISGDQVNILDVKEEAKTNKNLLLAIRKKTDQKMIEVESYYQKSKTDNLMEQQINKELYINTARVIFQEIACEMKSFLAKLYRDSEQEIAIAMPCKYAVIGLGSMALNQMTPYSDFEFAILTENDDYQRSNEAKIRDYFKNLSYLVNFKLINLGESIIPTSKYSIDIGHLIHKGVSFDLGGKTPLGRIDNDKPYELIKTVKGMMNYVLNEGNKVSHIDKNLPFILEHVCYVHGYEELVKNFQKKVIEFLHNKNTNDPQGRLNCEIRAIKLLQEGTVEIDYLQKQKINSNLKKTFFKGDLDMHKPSLFDIDNEGRLFNVKREIYRLPDRMIYNLGLYYGIDGGSGWDTVDKLEERNIITSKAAFNLKYVITFPSTVRLKIYSHYKAQNDDLSIFTRPANIETKQKKPTEQIWRLAEADLGEQGGLFHYFYTAIPLHKKLKHFCFHSKDFKDTIKQTYFQTCIFYKDDSATKGLIYYRLLQYKKSQSYLEIAVQDPKNCFNVEIRQALGIIYKYFGKDNQAIKLFKDCLEKAIAIHGNEPNLKLAICLDFLASSYRGKDYKKATQCSRESLKIFNPLNKRNFEYVSVCSNLALNYTLEGKYDEADKCFKMSQNMVNDLNVEKEFTIIDNGLILFYIDKAQFDKAIKYIKKNLDKLKHIYKGEPNNDVAAMLFHLGLAYAGKGLYCESIIYYIMSLDMVIYIHGEENNLQVAGCYCNLANVHIDIGQIDKAFEYYKKGIDMLKQIYKEPHLDVAIQLTNLGSLYIYKKLYGEANKCLKESLIIKELIRGKIPHQCFVNSFIGLGNICLSEGKYDQAKEYFKKSLNMSKTIHKKEPHPNVANALYYLALYFHLTKQYNKAIMRFNESLRIMKSCQLQFHPSFAASLNALGIVYRANNQYDQAVKYIRHALQIILSFKDHPYTNCIVYSLVISAFLVTTNTSNWQEALNKVLYFASQKLYFTGCKLQLGISKDNDNTSESQMAEQAKNYNILLKILFNVESETKLEICSKIKGHESADLVLAEAERNLYILLELITAEANNCLLNSINNDNINDTYTTPKYQQ